MYFAVLGVPNTKKQSSVNGLLELRFFIKNISDQILIYLISCCDEYISPTLKFASRILFYQLMFRWQNGPKFQFYSNGTSDRFRTTNIFCRNRSFWSLRFFEPNFSSSIFEIKFRDLIFRTFDDFYPRIGLFFHVPT